jgi:hypothetical protein
MLIKIVLHNNLKLKNMKQIIILAIAFFAVLPLTAQNTQNVQTKKERMLSETQTHIKFTDKDLPKFDMIGIFLPRTKVRRVDNKKETMYFYLIETQEATVDIEGKVLGAINKKTGGKEKIDWQWIEASDVVAINAALAKFKAEAEKDSSSTHSYVEQTYVTSEGFYVGYRVADGKVTWFIKMGPEDPELFSRTGENFFEAFANAQKEIEALKK